MVKFYTYFVCVNNSMNQYRLRSEELLCMSGSPSSALINFASVIWLVAHGRGCPLPIDPGFHGSQKQASVTVWNMLTGCCQYKINHIGKNCKVASTEKHTFHLLSKHIKICHGFRKTIIFSLTLKSFRSFDYFLFWC